MPRLHDWHDKASLVACSMTLSMLLLLCTQLLHALWPYIGKPIHSSISSMAVPEGVVCEVEAIMASAMPLNTKTDHILHVLTGAGLAHRQKLKPRSCLIHPENRAQSMLSFHDVWMKGASMSMVGFNAKLVEGNTIAFAMSTEPSRRAMQIEKNKALIEQSSGHLAPINGQEGQSPSHGSNPKPHVAFKFSFVFTCLQAI